MAAAGLQGGLAETWSATSSPQISGGPQGSRTPDLHRAKATRWTLTSWAQSSWDSADFTITAERAESRVPGESAVNRRGGPYTVGPDAAMSVGPLVSTRMGGPEPAMRAEQAYLAVLECGAGAGRVSGGRAYPRARRPPREHSFRRARLPAC